MGQANVTRRGGADRADRPSEPTAVAEVLVALRRELHTSALLEHCAAQLSADFLEEGSSSKCLVQVHGFGAEPVDDDALVAVAAQLATAAAASRARVEELLAQTVIARPVRHGAAVNLTARVVAREKATAPEPRGSE